MTGDALQDGMLRHYLAQVQSSDVNVERRIDAEPFDYRLHISAEKFSIRGGYRPSGGEKPSAPTIGSGVTKR
jgi:hypothetical protein